MNIVFLLPNLNAGGAERVAINYLRQLDLKKYAVTLVVFQKTQDLLPLVPSGVKLIDLETGSTSRSFWPLLKLLYRMRPDVVFSTHSRVAALLLPIKLFVPKFRHLARMQNTPSLERKYGAYGNIKILLYSMGYRCADVVIAQTEGMKEDGVATFGLRAEQVAVLPNPIDKQFIDECLRGMSSPFPDGQFSAVASGRLAYAKGFDVLISALPLVLEKHSNFILYILGRDVGEGAHLKKQVADLGLERHVMFLGYQQNPYVYYLYCDLYILSSRWEGFPNVLLENHYLSTPIVSTRCVPITEYIVQDGINGYLCDVDDSQDLQRAIICCMDIKRYEVKNRSYQGSRLEVLL